MYVLLMCCKLSTSVCNDSTAGQGSVQPVGITLLLCFHVLGTNRGPTDRIQHINKHSMICQVDTIHFLSEKHSLRKPPHAFGSELVKKSETVKAETVKV